LRGRLIVAFERELGGFDPLVLVQVLLIFGYGLFDGSYLRLEIATGLLPDSQCACWEQGDAHCGSSEEAEALFKGVGLTVSSVHRDSCL
jgi:hypothetical protein